MEAAVPVPPRLGRALHPTARAPIRIVHLGLGAFHRAHQAFYTDRVDTDRQWGIAAFTGRTPDMARTLAAQDGLYTLIERSDAGDALSTITSIVAAEDGADLSRLAELTAAATTAIITLTVTEAAYRVRGGALEVDADVSADLEAIRRPGAPLTTVPGRLTLALQARRTAGGGPIALVPCDNLADNAAALRASLLGFASLVDPELAEWIETTVSVVGTCVDRITPAATPADVAEVTSRLGYRDDAPVVTEPFHEWVLSGDFPAGRPAWEEAGARFVDDIRPYETRKLWLLNGAHSLLAYLGQLRGFATVAEAITDPACRRAVEQWWDLAEAALDAPALDLPAYRRELITRFENRTLAHRLAQIAIDGEVKLRQRVVPVILAAPDADLTPAYRILAAWMNHRSEPTAALLGALEPRWGEDENLITAVDALRSELRSTS